MKLLPVLLALSLLLPAAAHAQAGGKSSTKPAASKSTAKKPAAKKTTAKKSTAKKKSSVASKSRNSKGTVKRAIEATTPVQPATARLTDRELNLSKFVQTGKIQCELGHNISVVSDSNNPGFFNVRSGKETYYMHPVESATGALRLEDPRTGTVWLQLGNKSMLLNQRKGQRLADDCKTPQQMEVAENMKRAPSNASLLGQ